MGEGGAVGGADYAHGSEQGSVGMPQYPPFVEGENEDDYYFMEEGDLALRAVTEADGLYFRTQLLSREQFLERKVQSTVFNA